MTGGLGHSVYPIQLNFDENQTNIEVENLHKLEWINNIKANCSDCSTNLDNYNLDAEKLLCFKVEDKCNKLSLKSIVDVVEFNGRTFNLIGVIAYEEPLYPDIKNLRHYVAYTHNLINKGTWTVYDSNSHSARAFPINRTVDASVLIYIEYSKIL